MEGARVEVAAQAAEATPVVAAGAHQEAVRSAMSRLQNSAKMV